MLKFPPSDHDKSLYNDTIRPVKARIRYVNKHGEKMQIETELSILVVQEGRDEIEVNEDVMVNFYRCKGAEALKIISQLAEARKFNEAKELANKTANEFKECLVREHIIVAALIKDLEDAANRVSSQGSWEQGGRAQVMSVQNSHFAQKASNNAKMYMNCQQEEYCDMAMDFFGDE